TSSRMGHLWDALAHAYRVLGFARATGHDEVFEQLVLARIIEPVSKFDTVRVLDEVGFAAVFYPTINRRLPVYAKTTWRAKLAKACAAKAGLGPCQPGALRRVHALLRDRHRRRVSRARVLQLGRGPGYAKIVVCVVVFVLVSGFGGGGLLGIT